MKISIVTIHPELIEAALTAGVVGRARDAGVISVETINPRDFTSDRHRTVDDTPYGGGPGMVMKPEPLIAAIARAAGDPPSHRIFMSPAGSVLTQPRVRALSSMPHLVLVCGRYEGVDQRAIDIAIDEELSIGDYVLSGGELGALVVVDAIARLIPGVLGEPTSADEESHSAGLLEYPQYTRPPLLGDHAVPAVLTSGNHAAIATWRRSQAMQRTAARRPDLWSQFRATPADRKLVPPLASRTHLALVHHPVVDRTGQIVTSSLTNFDIHDLARSTMTYGLAAYHIVTPVTSQREKAEHIARLWLEDENNAPARTPPTSGSRANALALIRTAPSIEAVLDELASSYGSPPLVVATSARHESFPEAVRRSPSQLLAEAAVYPGPVLIMLGTGWGLADSKIQSVSRVLTPIEGSSDWNHLSVRSAGAILLDRLFGR
ncbi:MAG: tRNA (guanosine(37)-N1)-methyltransferase TrmD [Kofleriaceae bacterium]